MVPYLQLIALCIHVTPTVQTEQAVFSVSGRYVAGPLAAAD